VCDAATIASSVWQPDQIEEAVRANGIHMTYEAFHLLPKGVGIAFNRFSLGLAQDLVP
jgi:hypothetical protein